MRLPTLRCPGASAALLGALLWIGSGSALRAQTVGPYDQNQRSTQPGAGGVPAQFHQARRLYVTKCAMCHTLSRSMNKTDLSSQEWEDIVDRMRNRAASHMSDSEAKAILGYLVWNGEQRQKKEAEGK